MIISDIRSRIADLIQFRLLESDLTSGADLLSLLQADKLDELESLLTEKSKDAELVRQIKNLIARLKMMIGEVVIGQPDPNEIKVPGRDMASNESEQLGFRTLVETILPEFSMPLREAASGAVVWNVVALRQGLNSSGIREYTTPALESAARLINTSTPKIAAYANHPTAAEDAQRPERDIRDQIGWFHDAQVVGPELKTKLTVVDSDLNEKLRLAYEGGNPNFYGLSIRGNGKTNKVPGATHFTVSEITQLASVDVVTRAGAGGRFINLAESAQEVKDKEDLERMDKEEAAQHQDQVHLEQPEVHEIQIVDVNSTVTENKVEATIIEIEPTRGKEEMDNPTDLTEVHAALAEIKAWKASKMLEDKLSESKLPSAAQKRVRARFSESLPTPEAVDAAIVEFREVINEIVPDPRKYATVKVGEDSTEKMQKAMDAMLLGVPDVDGVPAFRSLREAYGRITGEDAYNMFGTSWAGSMVRDLKAAPTLTESWVDMTPDAQSRALREAEISTGSFTNIFGTSMKRVLLGRYHNLAYMQSWKKIVGPNVTNLMDYKTNDRLHLGGYGTLSVVAEGATYPEFAAATEERVQYAAQKRGGSIPVTREAILADDLGALRRIPQVLGDSAGYTLYNFVFDFLANNSAYDPDATALAAAGHNNRSTTALDRAELMTLVRLMREQTGPSGAPLMGTSPRYLVVPNELEDLAYRLTESNVLVQTSTFTATEPNIFNRVLGRYNLEVIVVDYWTDANNYWLVADPMLGAKTIEVGFINGQQDPQLFIQDDPTQGATFTGDKFTWKIRHEYGGDILDYRPFCGGIVT